MIDSPSSGSSSLSLNRTCIPTQTPNTGRPRRARSRGSARRGRGRSARARTRRTCPTPGITSASASRDLVGVACHARVAAHVRDRARDRVEVARAVVEDGDRRRHASQRSPWSEGTPSRPVRRARVAERLGHRLELGLAPRGGASARTAGGRGSSGRARVANARTKSSTQARVERADRSRRELDLVDDERAPGQVERRPRPRPRRAAP